jgi:hypothetical protein
MKQNENFDERFGRKAFNLFSLAAANAFTNWTPKD